MLYDFLFDLARLFFSLLLLRLNLSFYFFLRLLAHNNYNFYSNLR